MSLFEEQAGKITLPAYLTEIKEFKDLLEDKKSQSYLSVVFHMCDWESIYAQHPEKEREEKLKNDFLDGKEFPKKVTVAIDKYKELNKTDSLLLLESARKAVQKLRQYFDEADPSLEDDPGKSAKDLMQNLKSVGAIIESLGKWEETIKKERDNSTIRKGVTINEFNSTD